MKSAYVYYRIDSAQAPLAADRVDALLSAMAPHCGKPPRRLCRCDDPATWMEVYNDIADWPAFESAMQAALEAMPIGRFIAGDRHLECFAAPEHGA